MPDFDGRDSVSGRRRGAALPRRPHDDAACKLAGVLERVRGVIFGTCSDCNPGAGYASFTLEEILNDHLKPLKVPAWQGAMIGHGMPQWTLPVGLEVEIDAAAGTITMAEPAVT